MTTPARITAAMIVRDEEAYLGDCLRSIGDVVDEVVIVDTGSVDRSPDIAQAAGARVVSVPWSGDFAAARNRALDEARGDWILYVDADERVVSVDREAFRAQLGDQELAALTVRFRPASGLSRYLEPRIFRRHPEIRFEGRFHESHLPALRRHLRSSGRRIGNSTVEVDHLGYDGPQDHKHARNLPMLEARLADTPGHVYSWVHLGCTHEALGQRERARRAWGRGVERVRSKNGREPRDCFPFLALLHFGERWGEATDEILEESLELFPENLWLRWLEAKRWMANRRYEQALPLLEAIDARRGETVPDPVFAYDRRLLSVWIHDALGLCYFHLDRPAEAAARFRAAEEAEPTPERRAKRVLAAGRAAGGESVA